MTTYRVRLGPAERKPGWSLTLEVSAKSRNDARVQAIRKARPYLADRDIRIVRVTEV